ncbi:insulinase family protein [Alteromonas sediminis]|uniref:Insulinase family protein n=1 Tax=Alteromonas sediminis TaxID=2259342 RepID=A0A3N5YMG5_9ALTE|nr:insulinase family protein [Alteromonas sediminis]RPJ66581.1 insulinase family protein [Alteromonas sediminis]
MLSHRVFKCLFFSIVIGAIPTPLHANEALPTSEHIQTGTLENGIRYFIKQHQKPSNRAELRLIVDVGSTPEEESQRGFAHFVEHMAFNGTEDFAKQEIIDYMQSVGMRFGAHLNAYTSFNETVYKLTLPSQNHADLKKGIRILENWAHKVSFEPEEIDKERGVVLEEWRRGQSANQRIRDKQIPVIFNQSRYAERLPIGTSNNIENGSHADLIRFYKTWYRPERMTVVAVGDFDSRYIKALIHQYFGLIAASPEPVSRPHYAITVNESPLISIETDPELTAIRALFNIRKPALSRATKNDLKTRWVYGLVTQMINARLTQATQEGQLPVIRAGTSYNSLFGGIDQWTAFMLLKPEDITSGISKTLDTIYQAANHGFTLSELERSKTNMLKAFERAVSEEDKLPSASYANQVVAHVLNNAPLLSPTQNYAIAAKQIPSISVADVNHVVTEWLSERGKVITVSAPERSKESLPSKEALTTLWQAAKTKQQQAYQDDILEQSILDALPKPGSIVRKEYKESLDAHLWTLSNGARVWLKQTQHKNDEIVISARSFGGQSLVDDDKLSRVFMATSLVQQMGFGNFGQTELTKFNAGKAFSLRPRISSHTESVSGFSSVNDIEHSLLMLHAVFTSPRKDEKAFNTFISRVKPSLEQRVNAPHWAYSEAIRKAKFKTSPRNFALTPDLVTQFELEENVALYKQRFANAGDFVFAFVGNLDLEAMAPLIEQYIASLPFSEKREQWRETPDLRVLGAQNVSVNNGQAEKATVNLEWFGKSEWSHEESATFYAMSDVFSTLLRESLREEKGGVYGVNVTPGLNRIPQANYSIKVSFTCDPQRVDELVKEVQRIAALLAEQPPQDHYINNHIETRLKSREAQLESNAFWAGHLHQFTTPDYTPQTLAMYQQITQSLTAEKVHQAAKRYFNTNNVFTAVMLPATEED